MRQVIRRDGSAEPLLLQRIEFDLDTVLSASGERDGGLARELAGAVLHHLDLNHAEGDIREHELDDMLVRVLKATGHDDAALRFVEEREHREILLARLVVLAPGGEAPWSRQRLCDSLRQRTGLPEVLLLDLVAGVERRLVQLGAEHVTAGLVTELAATGLMEFDSVTKQAAATVSLSPRRLGELCSESGGHPLHCDRAIAAEVLERLLLQEIHAGPVAAAAATHLIALPGVGDPFRPALLVLGDEDAPHTLPALSRMVRMLLPCVRSRLVLPGFEALLAEFGGEAVAALNEGVMEARRAGAVAALEVNLLPREDHLDWLAAQAAGLGIHVAWTLPESMPSAEESAVLCRAASTEAAVRLRVVASRQRVTLLEVALNLPALLEGVAGADQADVAMTRAAGWIHAAEAERSRLVQGSSIAALLQETLECVAHPEEEVQVALWGLGGALDRLVAAGAGRSQDRPLLAARLLRHLDYASSDAAPRQRRFSFVTDAALRRRFAAASPAQAAAGAAVLPVEVPLFGRGNLDLLASGLSERLMGPVPLPAALLPDQGIPAFLRQLRTRTRLESVRFASEESAVLEVQGDLFRAPSAG